MALLLNVPICEERAARQLGALQDAMTQKWYAPDRSRYKQLSRWLMETCILCDKLYLVIAPLRCEECERQAQTLWFYQTAAYYKDAFGLVEDSSIKALFSLPPVPSSIAQQLYSEYGLEFFFSGYRQQKYCNRCANCGASISITQWLDAVDHGEYPQDIIIYPIKFNEDVYYTQSATACGTDDTLLKVGRLSNQGYIWE